MADIDRRTALKAGVVALLASPFAGMLAAPSTGSTHASVVALDPAVSGSWTAPFDLGGIAIHATVTRSGHVLFAGRPEGGRTDHTNYVGTWNYSTGAVGQAPYPYHRNAFCSAHTVLPDGRVFVAGGHEHDSPDGIGVADTDTYTPATKSWVSRPPLTEKRWYPTTVGMPNGRVLVFGGQVQEGVPAATVDEYDPGTNTMTRLPGTATRKVGMYPKLHVLSTGRVLKSGNHALTVSFNRATNSWSNVATMRFGDRWRGNFVLLDAGTRVLAVGGTTGTGPPTGTAEILDMSAAAPAWRSTGSLNHPRQLANSVILPDGQVLVVGGGLNLPYDGPIRTPELYDPVSGVWTALAPQTASRMYHSTAVLLPDGRVLSAGQDNHPLASYGEIFSPPYLFRGARPSISAAPSVMGYGQQITVGTAQAAAISRVVLIRPSSVTHQTDTDQRSVRLSFTAVTDGLTVRSPSSANVAPRGFYMLFVVDRNGVPSVARWVRVG